MQLEIPGSLEPWTKKALKRIGVCFELDNARCLNIYFEKQVQPYLF